MFFSRGLILALVGLLFLPIPASSSFSQDSAGAVLEASPEFAFFPQHLKRLVNNPFTSRALSFFFESGHQLDATSIDALSQIHTVTSLEALHLLNKIFSAKGHRLTYLLYLAAKYDSEEKLLLLKKLLENEVYDIKLLHQASAANNPYAVRAILAVATAERYNVKPPFTFRPKITFQYLKDITRESQALGIELLAFYGARYRLYNQLEWVNLVLHFSNSFQLDALTLILRQRFHFRPFEGYLSQIQTREDVESLNRTLDLGQSETLRLLSRFPLRKRLKPGTQPEEDEEEFPKKLVRIKYLNVVTMCRQWLAATGWGFANSIQE